MAIHVQDEETDWLVRDFARRRGVGITTAIKLAIEEATQSERNSLELVKRRMEPIWADLRAKKSDNGHDHRKFVDELWDD